ncbi:MAG: hypothetical protein M3137_12415 [Actinomycetota bacterium]|nr:hypothetical protein [Actinomycetota bacterium]
MAAKDDHDPDMEENLQDPQRGEAGEGIRAPRTTDGADHAEFSVFDGKGNESIVVVADDEEGKPSQGTGATSEEAAADANKPGHTLGEGFMPHA